MKEQIQIIERGDEGLIPAEVVNAVLVRNMIHSKLKDSATDTCTPRHLRPGQVCVRCKCYTEKHGFLN